jgi:hypothetical protein
MRNADVIAARNRLGLTLVFTGARHPPTELTTCRNCAINHKFR